MPQHNQKAVSVGLTIFQLCESLLLQSNVMIGDKHYSMYINNSLLVDFTFTIYYVGWSHVTAAWFEWTLYILIISIPD